MLGCECLYRLGPFGPSPTVPTRLGIHETARMRELRFYRLGDQAVLEVFQYDARGAATMPPRSSDVGGHHLAFYVEDLDLATAGLAAHCIATMGEPTTSSGASQGQRWGLFPRTVGAAV